MTQLEKFGKDLDAFFIEFTNGFRDWAGDFATLVDGRVSTAAAIPTFLRKRAQSLIKNYDMFLQDSLEVFEEIVGTENKPISLELKEVLRQKKLQFKRDLVAVIRPVNIKAELMLEDLESFQGDEELKKRLQELSTVTYEQIVIRFKL